MLTENEIVDKVGEITKELVEEANKLLKDLIIKAFQMHKGKDATLAELLAMGTKDFYVQHALFAKTVCYYKDKAFLKTLTKPEIDCVTDEDDSVKFSIDYKPEFS